MNQLRRGGLAHMTTTGRKTGQPRRIEISFHHFDGEFFIGGRPGFKRDWLANLVAKPEFTLQLKGAQAVTAEAEPVEDPDERGRLFYRMLTESWGSDPDKATAVLPRYVESSPLVRFRIGSNGA